MYVLNLDDKQSKGTHWISVFIERNTSVYFDSFGIEFILQEVLTQNIFRTQDKHSVMCRFYCIAFIKFRIATNTLLVINQLISPNKYKKNRKITYK